MPQNTPLKPESPQTKTWVKVLGVLIALSGSAVAIGVLVYAFLMSPVFENTTGSEPEAALFYPLFVGFILSTKVLMYTAYAHIIAALIYLVVRKPGKTALILTIVSVLFSCAYLYILHVDMAARFA